LAEGIVFLLLYITEPASAGVPTGYNSEVRALHYGIRGGILGMIVGVFGTPILSFILYRLLRNNDWFKKLQENLLFSITIFLTIIIALTAPFLVYTEYKKWKENQKYEQRLTSEDIKTKWFDHPANFNIPMKDVSISKEDGQVLLKMDYDEQAAKLSKIKDSRSEFQKDILSLIRNQVFDMSPYKELKTLSVKVRYKYEWYEFNQIPLKDERNQPFTIEDKEIKKIISDKMKISPSSSSGG
jgi:hypothetical protein